MIMKQVNLLVFASLCCLVGSVPQVYYVTPTQPDIQGSCHVNDTTLRPCYTLQQLNGILSSSSGSVEVLLLPGTHLIPEKETLIVSNFSEVVICPWKEELETVIECKNTLVSIWLHKILELKILSLRFSSCRLQYDFEMNCKTERSVNIAKTVFEKSSIEMIQHSTESNLNVIVSNCTFSSSNSYSAISIDTSYFNVLEDYIRRITIANLQITDTLFQHNTNVAYTLRVLYTNLMMDNCCFINNSNTFLPVSSSLTLKSTTFLYSHSALHLSRCSGTIDACLFSNSAGFAAVYIEGSPLSISNNIFEENSGTALYINIGTLKLII